MKYYSLSEELVDAIVGLLNRLEQAFLAYLDASSSDFAARDAALKIMRGEQS